MEVLYDIPVDLYTIIPCMQLKDIFCLKNDVLLECFKFHVVAVKT
jgi:hypothetical protein